MNIHKNNDVGAVSAGKGFKRHLQAVAVASAVAALAACGGGGDGGNNNPMNPPPGGGPNVGGAPIMVGATAIGDAIVGMGTVNVIAPDPNNAGSFMVVNRTDLNGYSLYTFDADTMPGMSTCIDTGCISNWPPLLVDPSANIVPPFTTLTRTDAGAGTNTQLAINGKPLYYFTNDTMMNDIAGDGVANIWRIATYPPVLKDRDPNNNPGIPGPNSDYLVSSGFGTTYVPSANDPTVFVPGSIQADRLSLYTFDPDVPGMGPQCNPTIDLGIPGAPTGAGCLANWPPLIAGPNDQPTGPYTLVDLPIDSTGTNTVKQWALNGKPLYFYTPDNMEGLVAGDAIPNWRLARPQDAQQNQMVTNTVMMNGTPMNTPLGTSLAGSVRGLTLLPTNGMRDLGNGFTLTPVTNDDVTVYTFDTDVPGTSNCAGQCLVSWPPVIAGPNADPQAPFSLVPVSAADATTPGQMMWAVNGKPLYYFIGDMVTGSNTSPAATMFMQNTTNGENVFGGGFWNVARTAPVRVANNSNANPNQILVSDGEQVDAAGNLIIPGAQGNQTQGVGFTLYTFDNDVAGSGMSTCTGGCLTNWPALYASPVAAARYNGDVGDVGLGDYSVIVRPETNPDGSPVFQWAYKGKPLYYYINDGIANIRNGNPAVQGNNDMGDITGANVANWRLAVP